MEKWQETKNSSKNVHFQLLQRIYYEFDHELPGHPADPLGPRGETFVKIQYNEHSQGVSWTGGSGLEDGGGRGMFQS